MPIELSEKDKLLKEIQDIVKEHGGLESNIPINHIYWKKLNQFKALANQ